MSSVFPNWFVPDSLFSVKVCPFCSQFHLDFYHEGGCFTFSKAFSATIDMIAAVSFSGQLGIICNHLGEGPGEKLSRSGFKGFSLLGLIEVGRPSLHVGPAVSRASPWTDWKRSQAR